MPPKLNLASLLDTVLQLKLPCSLPLAISGVCELIYMKSSYAK